MRLLTHAPSSTCKRVARVPRGSVGATGIRPADWRQAITSGGRSRATIEGETRSGTAQERCPQWTDDGVESGRFEAEGGTVRLRPTSSREKIVSKIEKPYMFGYVRVSAEEQAESRNGIEAQEAVLIAEAERRGWDLEVFRDEGKSGKFVNEGLREVLDLLGSGQGDGLVVAKMDRLARSVIHAATITERAQKQGWSLVVIDLNLDFTTASGRLMGHMLMSFAEFERGVIGERTSAALAAKKRRGEPVGPDLCSSRAHHPAHCYGSSRGAVLRADRPSPDKRGRAQPDRARLVAIVVSATHLHLSGSQGSSPSNPRTEGELTMANVRKITRPDGTRFYQVRWRTPDGKHRTKGGFPTKRAAEDYVNEVDYAQRRSTTFDPKAGAVSFREAAQDWLSSRHDLKRSTHAGYEHALTPKYSAGNTNTNTNSSGTAFTHEVKNARRDTVNAAAMAKRQALSIDATFGGYPINKITRTQISEWVSAMAAAGSKPSTVRHAFFIVRMVLAQGVVDGRLATNPADYVRLPSERSAVGGTPGVVDDPAQFLTAAQVAALVAATPWPYTVTVHLAAWAGLRAAADRRGTHLRQP